MANIKADEITKILREQIENYQQAVAVEEVGSVIAVGDGIARIHGLERCMVGFQQTIARLEGEALVFQDHAYFTRKWAKCAVEQLHHDGTSRFDTGSSSSGRYID